MSSTTTTTTTTTTDSTDELPMKLKSSFTPDLPQEIVDLIIDNLQDDPLALRACALTAHNWVHRSRRHLHSRIRIGEYYINLARYSCPQTAQYVREMDLYMVRTNRGRQRTTTEHVWQMLQRFPNLTALVMRDFEFYRLTPEKRDILFGITANLRSLDLHGVFFENAPDFLTTVDACGPLLRSLSLHDVKFYTSPSVTRAEEECINYLEELQVAGKALPGSGLHSLTVGTSALPFEKAMNVWIGALTRRGLLKTLTLSKDVPNDCAGTLAAVGPSPIDLRLARCNLRAQKPSQTGIEVCTNIRSLTFITSMLVPPRTSDQSCIIPFLQQLPSTSTTPPPSPSRPSPLIIPSRLSPTHTPLPPLRTITFELHWSDKDAIDVDFLTEIDHILSSRKDTFGAVQDVVFTIHKHLSLRPQNRISDSRFNGPFADARSLPQRATEFKMFLRKCLGTHLKGVLARPTCNVKLVFPCDGDVFKVVARGVGEECRH